jgi:NTP pyrophosphatase (non-canonical NTP hydrolase)
MSEINDLMAEIIAFRDARDWGQFHTLRHLAAGLSIEAAELQEIMLWRADSEVEALLSDPTQKLRLQREVADILIFALMICHHSGLEPARAIREKLAENASKYPVDLARGRAIKYTDLGQPLPKDKHP